MIERRRVENKIAKGQVVQSVDPRVAKQPIPWWGWVLIGAGVLVSGGGITHTLFAVRHMKAEKEAGKGAFIKSWKATTFYGRKVKQ